jgi:hypothetical protein
VRLPSMKCEICVVMSLSLARMAEY